MNEWQTVERPGPFGAMRDQRYAEYDIRFGSHNWRIAWQSGAETLEWDQMARLYEDAYFAFLGGRPELVDRLAQFANVYEDAESNIDSGTEYNRQESSRNHITDIVVRRCLTRLGRRFEGTRLLQLATSSRDPLASELSPGRIPFHRAELITGPELTGWWKTGSVESFYQSNKVLQIKRRTTW